MSKKWLIIGIVLAVVAANFSFARTFCNHF